MQDTQVARALVTGNPAHIEQLDDANNLMQGDAAQLDYDNINGIAVLTGNAVVRQQGRGEFHGDKLTYNTNTALITGQAGGDGLVHGVILPKPKPGTPGAPAAAPAKPATPRPDAGQADHHAGDAHQAGSHAGREPVIDAFR